MDEEKCSTKSYPWVPLEVTVEILLRLPAKSVARFSCVSKLWSSTTTTPWFIKSFAVHSSARQSILSVKKVKGKQTFFSLPHHQQDPESPSAFVKNFEMMVPKGDHYPTYNNNIGNVFNIRDSICGLVCFENIDSVIIWNPTLRQTVTLPQPYKITKPLTSLLGYDPIAGEHKVLCMSVSLRKDLAKKNGEDDPQIFTLRAHESWRKTKTSPIHLSMTMRSWRCINGVLYYYGMDHNTVSFDVRSEKFLVINKPDCDMSYLPSALHSLINYRGKLGWIYDGPSSVLWVLEDVEKQEWSSRRLLVPFRRHGYLKLSGATGDGELIYAPTGRPDRHGPFDEFYYYDLKTNITRKVTYRGIDDYWFNFVSFPNHTESLVSLVF
ncbi:unnamed protein product [Microthlaspi erraticum]|uniref:F-box domain-containing protein n=1 Tax=Microthlaspi erraticum TaxID=1685480 RepID=A0A6D2HI24_9BRAS|nr:unnamed protein product [Microthlaspi erraticum]